MKLASAALAAWTFASVTLGLNTTCTALRIGGHGHEGRFAGIEPAVPTTGKLMMFSFRVERDAEPSP